MGCCILGALLISQMIAIWKTQKLRMLLALCTLVTIGVLLDQLDKHWDHLVEDSQVALAYLTGDDPAWVAANQRGLVCKPKVGASIVSPITLQNRLGNLTNSASSNLSALIAESK